MNERPTVRLTVANGGLHGEILYGVSAKVIEGVLYGDVVPDDPVPPFPTADGVYLLVDNKWVPE